jgi:hypothetical protein
MQIFLVKLVTVGTKTSTGFKKVHLNSCAKAVNEHFKVNRIGSDFESLKDIKKRYTRINYLKNLSTALWNEDEFIISFDHEYYTNHFEVIYVAKILLSMVMSYMY